MHTELLADHKNELEKLQTSHATAITDLADEHQRTIAELGLKLKAMEEKASVGAKETESLRKSLVEVSGHRELLQEAAGGFTKLQSGGKEELAKALRHNAELMDELEGTKTVSYIIPRNPPEAKVRELTGRWPK